MKILVTGANGYLGVGIVKSLIDLGHIVVATDISLDRVDDRAQKISCDVFGIENPYEYFNQPDCLLHLAWRDGFFHYSDAHIEDLPKHKTFLEKMCVSGLKSVSVMGTMHEIGFYEGSVDENTPCKPQNYYGIAKNALREITDYISREKNINYKWLRAFYIVSNSPNGYSIFSKIVQAEKGGQKLFPFTTGKNQYDFLDYNVFCKQVALAISQNSINGIINISCGRPESLASRVERFIMENDFKIKLNYGVYNERSYDSKAIWGNDNKMKKIIKMYYEKNI